MRRIGSLGYAVFALTMISLGVLGLIKGDFTPIWTGVPKGMPAREVLAYLCAFVSLVTGIGLLWQRTASGCPTSSSLPPRQTLGGPAERPQ